MWRGQRCIRTLLRRLLLARLRYKGSAALTESDHHEYGTGGRQTKPKDGSRQNGAPASGETYFEHFLPAPFGPQTTAVVAPPANGTAAVSAPSSLETRRALVAEPPYPSGQTAPGLGTVFLLCEGRFSFSKQLPS